MNWHCRHITGFSSFILGALVLSGSMLTGCEKDQVAEYARPEVQLIPMNDTLRNVIAENTLLTNTHAWYIEGWVYISNEATLTIEPGTIIKVIGKNDTGAGLVITRGAKIMANGLSNWPILFQLADTTRGWSGIVLLGKAPQKRRYPLTEHISAAPDSGGWAYGGEQADDSSGVLQHIRIAARPDKGNGVVKNKFPEGLLLLGVGSKTVIQDITIDTAGSRYYYMEAKYPE